MQGDKLQNPESYYQTVFQKNLERHKNQDKKILVASV